MNRNKHLTSIIFTAYDSTQTMRLITQAALQNIIKYTDEEDYELIFIDTIPENAPHNLYLNPHYVDEFFKLNKRVDRVWIKRVVAEIGDPGQYATYNIGAKLAKGDYICFFQNDVFVNEGWLKNLRYYLDNDLADIVYPDQQAKPRDYVKKSYRARFNSRGGIGGARDAGLILMTKKAFNKLGGWNETIRIHYGEKDLFTRASQLQLREIITRKCLITHLEHAAGWTKLDLEKDKYDKDSTISAKEIQKYD